MGRMQEIVGIATQVGGGALAGYLDTKFSDKKVAGQGLGTVAAIAGIGAGLALKSTIAKHALRIGTGAAAFEAGKLVQNKVLGVSGVRGYGVRGLGGVRGVASLPTGQRPLSATDLDAHLAYMRARQAA